MLVRPAIFGAPGGIRRPTGTAATLLRNASEPARRGPQGLHSDDESPNEQKRHRKVTLLFMSAPGGVFVQDIGNASLKT
jgi:hypothetical protein